MIDETEEQRKIREMNERLSQTFQEMMNKSPGFKSLLEVFGSNQANYRYYSDKKKDRYFYTTGKIEHKGLQRYVAGIYKYQKTKDNFKLVRTVGFAKKKRAIDWAYKNYVKAKSV